MDGHDGSAQSGSSHTAAWCIRNSRVAWCDLLVTSVQAWWALSSPPPPAAAAAAGPAIGVDGRLWVGENGSIAGKRGEGRRGGEKGGAIPAKLPPVPVGAIATGSADKGDAVSWRGLVTLGLGVWRESRPTGKKLTVGGDWALAFAPSGVGASVPAVAAIPSKLPSLLFFSGSLASRHAVVDVKTLHAASTRKSVEGRGVKADSAEDDSCSKRARRLARSITRRCV
jgi:hypothetical protein